MTYLPCRKHLEILGDILYSYWLDNDKKVEDISILGSAIQLADDENITLDPAAWNDWLEAIDGEKAEIILDQNVWIIKNSYQDRYISRGNQYLDLKKGYIAAQKFLTKWMQMMGDSVEIKDFAEWLTYERWSDAVGKTE